MKKIVLTLTVLVLLVVMIGADIRRTDKQIETTAQSQVKKKRCYGYTIIEYGKGVNCNGDTISLVKVDGIQRMQKELASAE
jgi:hypothetical protein